MPSELSALIRERQPCVVLTGAGISTESGIPDFRSPTGVWAQYDLMEYATIEAFRRDPVKVGVLRQAASVLRDARPNAAHLALAELERRGLLAAVITQNVDRLHSKAGSNAVVEVHGSTARSVCLRCGAAATFEEVLALLEDAPAPACARCGAILKPDVVMFGELLPAPEIDRAFELARSARLLLVVGSTLEVHPVAGLPLETLAAGGALAIVNRGPTAFDDRAQLRIDGAAGEILGGVLKRFAKPRRGGAASRRARAALRADLPLDLERNPAPLPDRELGARLLVLVSRGHSQCVWTSSATSTPRCPFGQCVHQPEDRL